jgi:hypothetical protein
MTFGGAVGHSAPRGISMLHAARAMLPFTSEQFHAVFSAYNAAIWPIQIIAYGLGFLSVLSLVNGTPRSSRFVTGALG